MDKSSHLDVSVLIGIIKYAASKTEESCKQGTSSRPSRLPSLNLPECLVAIGKDLARLSASIGGTVVGGMLPDVLEPPSTPNHRSFMHSLVAGGIATAIAEKSDPARRSHECGFIGQLVLDFLASVPVGYLTHLLCDATTRRGLPLMF